MGDVTYRSRSEAMTPPSARDRPPAWSSSTVALVATPQTARSAIPFLSVLGLGRSVASWQQLRAEGGRPDAFVATRVELVPGLVDAPVAVFVNDRPSLRAAAHQGVEVALTNDQRLLDHGAVLVPRAGVDIARWRVRSAEERAEARRALGLPDDLAIAVDHPHVTDDVLAALSLAAAAVVTGPMVPLALALGTPVVTSPVSAERLGLHPGLEVQVVAGRRRADAAARALANDPRRATELSRRARRFAEHHLDLGHAAEIVAERLGLPPVEGLPSPTDDDAGSGEPSGRFVFEWPEDLWGPAEEPSDELDDVFVSDDEPVAADGDGREQDDVFAGTGARAGAGAHDRTAEHAVTVTPPPTWSVPPTTSAPVRRPDVPAVLRPATIDLVARRPAPS